MVEYTYAKCVTPHTFVAELEYEMTVEEKRHKEAMVQFLFNTYKKYYPQLLEKRKRKVMEAEAGDSLQVDEYDFIG